jgi:hypothetical protein
MFGYTIYIDLLFHLTDFRHFGTRTTIHMYEEKKTGTIDQKYFQNELKLVDIPVHVACLFLISPVTFLYMLPACSWYRQLHSCTCCLPVPDIASYIPVHLACLFLISPVTFLYMLPACSWYRQLHSCTCCLPFPDIASYIPVHVASLFLISPVIFRGSWTLPCDGRLCLNVFVAHRCRFYEVLWQINNVKLETKALQHKLECTHGASTERLNSK